MLTHERPTPAGVRLIHRDGDGETEGLSLGSTLSHPPGDQTYQACAEEEQGPWLRILNGSQFKGGIGHERIIAKTEIQLTGGPTE